MKMNPENPLNGGRPGGNEWVCLNQREMEEQAIAEAQLPGTLNLSFHDGISLNELRTFFETKPGTVLGEIEDLRNSKGFLVIEIGTTTEPTKDPARRRVAENLKARGCERSRKVAHYIEMVSNPSDPANYLVLSDEFTNIIVEKIDEILKGRPPDKVTRYFRLEFRHHKLERPK
jgi:hypothetical protein